MGVIHCTDRMYGWKSLFPAQALAFRLGAGLVIRGAPSHPQYAARLHDATMAEKRGLLLTVKSRNDHEYSIRPIRWTLKVISLWPRSGIPTFFDNILSEFATLFSSFLILFMLVPYALCLFLDDEVCRNLEVRDFGPFVYWLAAGMKYCSLLRHVGDIRQCIDHMETDWKMLKTRQEEEVMLENVKVGRVALTVCGLFIHCGVFSYDIARGMTKTVIVVGNDTITTRTLPYIFPQKIYDTRHSPAYEITFVLQLLSTLVINSITAGSCGLAALLIMHARGQLKILVSRFDEFIDGNGREYDNVERRLAIIVNHHLRVFRFSTLMEEVLNIVCLVEVVGSTMFICVLGYCMITEWSMGQRDNTLGYCFLLFGFTFNIFVYCVIGEILSEQSTEIGQKAYMTEWYRLPGKTAINLVLVIIRSQSAITINAGKIIQLSLATFTNVLTTSFTYFNMLRTVIQNT